MHLHNACCLFAFYVTLKNECLPYVFCPTHPAFGMGESRTPAKSNMEPFAKNINSWKSEYYNSLISGEQKFVPDKFRPKINKNTPEYEQQLKREDAIQNVVREIKLLHARSKDFQSKIKDIDEKVFSKIESLDKENDIKLSIKSCCQESCENEENKSRDLWIKSLEELKNTYDEEMKKDKDHFLKFESEKDQGNRSESNNRHNRNSKNGHHHNQRGRGRYRHYSRRD